MEKQTFDKGMSIRREMFGAELADKTWAACEKRVKGVKGAKYKKVFSKEEETELIQDYTLASLI